LHISIQDNGCSIETHNLDNILELFFTTRAVGKGTGQGQVISRSMSTAAATSRLTNRFLRKVRQQIRTRLKYRPELSTADALTNVLNRHGIERFVETLQVNRVPASVTISTSITYASCH
jgi:hypothetical protein